MRSCLICLLMLLALPAWAQIYKYTDAEGNTAYSNQPPQGTAAQTVELPPLNSVQPQAPVAPMVPVPRQNDENQPLYRTLQLTDIPTEEALRANNGTFTVGVLIDPRLRQEHRLRLLLDGQPYGPPTNVPRLQLVSLDRGDHSLAVQVLLNDRVVQQSPTVTFTLQRFHLPPAGKRP
ncbi:hypothetical protein PMM47T1_09181 [Pseudomonas sp. M47T1]|uniref:DUF4124 domain-containing protein n=1 Tax=Pseudomonas sp. M47T1 TaxID=1179778 RepID=UPI000260859A|nr:DUF4124 domain-containing protein [Pseudomonas sp. M47T1]EIK96820.1 hypothetical protein PMM47T1_09181 [Pseudomonas sp. M47T1]